jgi:glutaminase
VTVQQSEPLPVQQLIARAHRELGEVTSGTVSSVYPALAEADPHLFGIAVAGVRGQVSEVGDSRARFTIMSCAKPFVFALVCQARGLDDARSRIGVNATGLPFNSLAAVERDPSSRTNPMVNAGALVSTSLLAGESVDERWDGVLRGLSGFAGRTLQLHEGMYASASASNQRNRALALLLTERSALDADPEEVTDLYTRVCCLEVSAVDLAVMGATLAAGGVNPVTRTRVVDADVARATIAVMAVAGLYETTGDWLLDVGLPGKSGIGGGIVTVSPGKGGLGTFAPPLDAAGNSVKGQLVAQQLARDLGLDIFSAGSEAEGSATQPIEA